MRDLESNGRQQDRFRAQKSAAIRTDKVHKQLNIGEIFFASCKFEYEYTCQSVETIQWLRRDEQKWLQGQDLLNHQQAHTRDTAWTDVMDPFLVVVIRS